MKLLIDVPVEPAALAALQSIKDVTVDVIDPPAEVARELPAAQLAAADALFCTVPPMNLREARKLKWIQVASVGYSQLYGLDLSTRGIRASNARGCFDVPIAEWNIAMMVNLARDLRQMVRNQNATVWDRSAKFQREIRGLTVGLWGYGGIGRETARLAKALGLHVHVLTRSGMTGSRGNVYAVSGTGDPDGTLPDRVFGAAQIGEFLSDLDFLILAMPLTKVTEGLVGEAELKALPRRAFVLNPARGPIVQEAALLRALNEGWIAGAALDTHYYYPMPPEHRLWHLPNVILTPHIAGSSLSPNFTVRLWDIFKNNLERLTTGRPILNELTPAQLAGL